MIRPSSFDAINVFRGAVLCVSLATATGCLGAGEAPDGADALLDEPLGDAEQGVAACGVAQADPDPWFPGNTTSYSNGSFEGTGDSCLPPGAYGERYQCVEYAQRYYAVRFGHPNIWSGVGSAYQMCDNHPSGVHTFNLNTTAVWHGDLIVLPATPGNRFGHVAVIDRDNGDGTVAVVEQNAGSGGRRNIAKSAALCGLWSSNNQGPY
ncbi:CHAP domain-containing protein [Sorangium sp. So ce269]